MSVRRYRLVRIDNTRARARSRVGIAVSVLLLCVLVTVAVTRSLFDSRGTHLVSAHVVRGGTVHTLQDAQHLQSERYFRQPAGVRLRNAVTLHGQPPAVQAKSAFVFDPGTGVVFFQKNADDERQMASTAKLMTLLLAVQDGDLNEQVTIGADAAALVNSDNSYMGVSAGEQLSLGDLLYGLVLPSGNDAAVAIADAIGGNVASFVAMMNERAQELGLTSTFYFSPDGLDDANHTSARDLAVLGAVALRYPVIEQVTSTLHDVIPQTATHKQYDLWSGDDLLSGARSPYPGTIGLKPGFTDTARYCQVFAARRQGHLIVGAVLGDPTWGARIGDMRALLDFSFEQDRVAPAPPAVPWSDVSSDQ